METKDADEEITIGKGKRKQSLKFEEKSKKKIKKLVK